jgi:hypothetical protein
MQVQADHKISEVGCDKMVLTEHAGGDPIVTAERTGCCGESRWKITAPGQETVTVDARREAVDEMIQMAYNILPGDGYVTFVPGEWCSAGESFTCLRDKD